MSIYSLLWLAAVTANVLAVLRHGLLSSAWVRPDLINTVLLRLLHARNFDRARKLCSSAPKSPYCAALASVFESVEQRGASQHPLTGMDLATLFHDRYNEEAKQLDSPKWIGVLGWLVIMIPTVQSYKLLLSLANGTTLIALFAVAALLQVAAELRLSYIRRAGLDGATNFLPQITKALEQSPPVTAE